ncbi:hypothetical protein BKA61DRAFT_672725 [Leptodontidium sp. MPI-SDFR-AT-0119]|nr:hypothetical protein BKA61DRAFT_672725 [Leptodontidium sp. MPI-SDFR-AT-0119]
MSEAKGHSRAALSDYIASQKDKPTSVKRGSAARVDDRTERSAPLIHGFALLFANAVCRFVDDYIWRAFICFTTRVRENATLSTPEQELSKNLLKQEVGRYLVRRRTKRSNEEAISATQLIEDLCAREHLEVEKVAHIGTSITEEYLHIVFDYGDPGHTVATINAYKGKKMKRISVPPEMTTYINRRVDNWMLLHNTQGIGFPIQDEVLQSFMPN